MERPRQRCGVHEKYLRLRKVTTDNVEPVLNGDREKDTEQRHLGESTERGENITADVQQGLRQTEPTGMTTKWENKFNSLRFSPIHIVPNHNNSQLSVFYIVR